MGGLAQLFASVVLLSSAWPLTKIAIGAGATPIWFAEGRAVLSGLVAAAILANLVLHEPFTPDLLLGAALIMVGVGFAAWPRGARRR